MRAFCRGCNKEVEIVRFTSEYAVEKLELGNNHYHPIVDVDMENKELK